MAKFYGIVGYGITEKVDDEEHPGIWRPHIVDRAYYGDTINLGSRWQSANKVNDDLTITNQFSILADPFAYDHYSSIRYVEHMGVKWKVTAITVERPRIILTVGGVYNG